MTTTEIINLAAGIGLGIISLILSIFAIWLSLRFNESSNAALDAVKELAREIRTLVQIGLSQQNDLSTKMLDSIIEQNRYSRPESEKAESTTSFEASVRKSLEDAEKNITNSVEKKIRDIIASGATDPVVIESEIEKIRSNIQKYSGIVKDQSNVIEALRSFVNNPAHYVLLAAILDSNAHSPSDIDKVAKKYSIPSGWEAGALISLLQKGLLQGSEDEFEIPAEIRQILKGWVQDNRLALNKLAAIYRLADNQQVDKQSGTRDRLNDREIAQTLKF